MSRLPTYFLSHGGGPCFFMDWDPPHAWDTLAEGLRAIPAQLPEPPRAVLWVSAHWEAEDFRVTAHPQPPLIYDYHGFPPHTYALRYPVPGAPALAEQVVAAVRAAGLSATADPARGFDHGLFIPGLVMFPEATIPSIQLSLRRDLSPAAHLECGRALAGLRDEGVLILGSGYSYHNLRMFGPPGAAAALTFDGWLQTTLCGIQGEAREARLRAWAQAPAARQAHPREEHLLPLMVAVGAASDEPGVCTFSEPVLSMQTSLFRFG